MLKAIETTLSFFVSLNFKKSMRFGASKIVTLIFAFLGLIVSGFLTYYIDTYRETREELTELYNHKLENCQITNIKSLKYPGKGYYKLFKTNCSDKYYPILLAYKSEMADYNFFEKGLLVSKDSLSTTSIISNENEIKKIEFRQPSMEDDRFQRFKFLMIFFSVFIVIILFIPSSFWEPELKRKDNK